MPSRVETHLPIVYRMARSMCRRLPAGQDLDDLVGAGALGLVEAAERFDERRGVDFEAYAALRVRGAMLDLLRSGCASSRGARRRARQMESRRRELAARLGRPPEDEELAEALGRDGPVFDEAVFRLVSLQELHENDDDRLRSEPESTTTEPTVLEDLVRKGACARLEAALDRISDRHRIVLSLYYLEELKLKEIGEIIGVTESRVCQLRRQALARLRELLED